MCHAGTVTVRRIKIVGPATHAVQVATELADADGVEMTSSKPPVIVADDTVELEVAVEGTPDDIADAVSSIRKGLPKGASIELADD
jgi:hypothetical protein